MPPAKCRNNSSYWCRLQSSDAVNSAQVGLFSSGHLVRRVAFSTSNSDHRTSRTETDGAIESDLREVYCARTEGALLLQFRENGRCFRTTYRQLSMTRLISIPLKHMGAVVKNGRLFEKLVVILKNWRLFRRSEDYFERSQILRGIGKFSNPCLQNSLKIFNAVDVKRVPGSVWDIYVMSLEKIIHFLDV